MDMYGVIGKMTTRGETRRVSGNSAAPSVKEAIAKGRPLIAGFSNRVVTTPVGGQGLPGGKR